MDLGNEISLNFKASIKKRLKESGTYIDDELPEYIMVMIANKRNEYQMKDDLSLFLGDETENFVTWLFVMLQRLQNAAKVETTNSEAKPSTEASLPKTEPLEEEIQTIKDNEIKSEEIINETESHKDNNIDKAKTIANSEDGARSIKHEESLSQDENKIKRDETNYEKEKEGKEYSKHLKRLKRRHRSRSGSPTKKQDDSDDERRQSREQKRSSRHRRRSSGSSKRTRTDSHGDQEETNEPSQTIASQVTVQKVRPSLPASRQATGALIKRAMLEANVSVKPRSSSEHENEAETKNVPLDISVEVKNDRRRMLLKREKKPEENVEVSSRLQEEANDDDSEAGGKRPKLADVEKHQDDGIEVEVPENEFLDEESISKKGSDQRIVIAHTFNNKMVKQSESKSRNEESNTGTADNEREKAYEANEENLHVNGVEEHEKADSVQDEKSDRPKRERRKHRHRRDKSDHREKRPSKTRFVVTLHGALDEASKIEKRRPLRSRHERRLSGEDPLFIDMNPKAPMVILESAQQEIDKMARKLDIMQNLLPTSAAEQYNVSISSNNLTIPLLPQNVPSLPVMPARVGLQGNVLPGQFNPSNIHASSFIQQQSLRGIASLSAPVIVMQNMSDSKLTSKPKIKQREIIVPLRGEKDDVLSDADSVEQTEEETTNTVTERCRFWPKCSNSSCQYIHPTIPCRMFPSCNFKDKCIFLHPMCKFDNRCTKQACPYTHAQKQRHVKPKLPQQNGTSLDVSIPICHFYPNCSKSNCPFRHPPTKACRYGSACNRKDCPFHHETRPATGDSLKWSVNSKQSQKHKSDRPFAVSQQEVTSIPVKVSTT